MLHECVCDPGAGKCPVLGRYMPGHFKKLCRHHAAYRAKFVFAAITNGKYTEPIMLTMAEPPRTFWWKVRRTIYEVVRRFSPGDRLAWGLKLIGIKRLIKWLWPNCGCATRQAVMNAKWSSFCAAVLCV